MNGSTKKTLHLNLKRVWFDMIKSGEKKEEYRELTVYYVSAFFDYKKSGLSREKFLEMLIKDDGGLWVYLKDFNDVMYFENGYKKLSERPRFDIIFDSIDIGTGNPNWGAIPGKKYFILELGKIL